MILIFSLTLAYKGPQGKEQIWGRRDILRLASVYIKKPLEYQLRVSEDLEFSGVVDATTAYIEDVTPKAVLCRGDRFVVSFFICTHPFFS